jgi:tetratricopeptide (TPR) repeat protein
MKLASVALVFLLVLPVAARAQQSDQNLERKRRAYALMEEGKARFDLGKFDESIDLFQKAYEVYPYPEALYSIAQGFRMKKDYERAVFFYKSYLRNAPGAENREAVEARIAELQRLDAEQKASAKEPPQGVQQPAAPPPGRSSSKPEPEPEKALPWYRDGWGWALVGGGALLGAGGAFLVVDGRSQEGDQLGSDLNAETITGWSMIGVGGAALVLGVFKLASPDAPRESRSTAFLLGPRYIGLAGTF